VCRPWRGELEARGFCSKTVHLCSALAEGGDAALLRQNAVRRLEVAWDDDAPPAGGWLLLRWMWLNLWRRLTERTRAAELNDANRAAATEREPAARLRQNMLRSLNASSGNDAERALCLDGGAFLAKSLGWKGSLQEWLQAASQEPDASFLSRGATSTAQSLGLQQVRWVAKPQGGYPESYALPGHSKGVITMALSRDGTRAASASPYDLLVKIWNAETGAEVSSLE